MPANDRPRAYSCGGEVWRECSRGASILASSRRRPARIQPGTLPFPVRVAQPLKLDRLNHHVAFAYNRLDIVRIGLGSRRVLSVEHRQCTDPDTYEASANLEYGSDPRQKLDVYQPRPTPDTRVPPDGYPVVVFFYGGSWTSGERRDYKFIGEALASHGIVTIVADYRLYPQVRYPDFLIDCARVVAWAEREATLLAKNTTQLFSLFGLANLLMARRWLLAAHIQGAS